MTNDVRKAKIKWQCRRGMLELDLILNSFVNSTLDNLTEQQFSSLENLLTYPDPMVYHWLLGTNDGLDDKDLESIVKLIRMQNINK